MAQPVGAEVFEKKIQPVLADRCYIWHSSQLKAPMGGLALDTKGRVEERRGFGAGCNSREARGEPVAAGAAPTGETKKKKLTRGFDLW